MSDPARKEIEAHLGDRASADGASAPHSLERDALGVFPPEATRAGTGPVWQRAHARSSTPAPPTKVDAAVARLDQGFARLEAISRESERRSDRLAGALATLEQRISALEGASRQPREREIDTQVADLRAMADEVKGRCDELRAQESAVGLVLEQVQQAVAQIAEVKGGLSQLTRQSSATVFDQAVSFGSMAEGDPTEAPRPREPLQMAIAARSAELENVSVATDVVGEELAVPAISPRDVAEAAIATIDSASASAVPPRDPSTSLVQLAVQRARQVLTIATSPGPTRVRLAGRVAAGALIVGLIVWTTAALNSPSPASLEQSAEAAAEHVPLNQGAVPHFDVDTIAPAKASADGDTPAAIPEARAAAPVDEPEPTRPALPDSPTVTRRQPAESEAQTEPDAPAPASLSTIPRPTTPTVLERRPAAAPPRAAQFVGRLQVVSEPAGAMVFVDAQPVGRTPVDLAQVKAGSHAVWVEHDGYGRWTSGVVVPADRVTRVSATLHPTDSAR